MYIYIYLSQFCAIYEADRQTSLTRFVDEMFKQDSLTSMCREHRHEIRCAPASSSNGLV